MDLDIPGEGSGEGMDLPPIQEKERPDEENVPPETARQPAEGERDRGGVEEATRSAESPKGGIVPFLLEEPEVRRGATGAGSGTTAEPASGESLEDIPVRLKTVSPPPSHADSLRLHPGAETSEGGPSQAPEIPLLKGADRGQSGPEPSLMMKPLPDVPGHSEARRPAATLSQPSRRPEDTLQVREDIDARLLEIFERYYRSR
jgi:hypothetical protein